MRVEETTNTNVARRIYEAQQAAAQEAQNQAQPVQKDQPAQATGTAATIDTYASLAFFSMPRVEKNRK